MGGTTATGPNGLKYVEPWTGRETGRRNPKSAPSDPDWSSAVDGILVLPECTCLSLAGRETAWIMDNVYNGVKTNDPEKHTTPHERI
jgi:hypothetical protein